MGGALAGGVLMTNEGSDGCSLLASTLAPSLSILIDESVVAVESAEDVPPVQREASFTQRSVTTAIVDVVPSDS